MVKTLLALLAALVVLVVLAGGIIGGAKSVIVPVTQEHYQTCLDNAEAQHTNPIDCPKNETLWDRGFEEPVAYYTLWLALFTVALAVGALVQSVLVGRQISLAREEFNSTFRPHLTVRNVHALEAGPGDEMAIQFELINNGSSKATVVASDFEVNFVRRTETFMPTCFDAEIRPSLLPGYVVDFTFGGGEFLSLVVSSVVIWLLLSGNIFIAVN